MDVVYNVSDMFQGVLEDIQTLQPNVSNINDIYKSLSVCSEEEFEDKFTKDVDDLNERWKAVNKLANDQNTTLKHHLGETQVYLDKMAELEMWMDRQIKDHLAREYTVHSLEELQALHENFKVFNIR